MTYKWVYMGAMSLLESHEGAPPPEDATLDLACCGKNADLSEITQPDLSLALATVGCPGPNPFHNVRSETQ